MNSIDPSIIRTYVNKLVQKGYDNDTIVRKLNSSLEFMRWAYHNDVFPYSVFQQIKDEIANYTHTYGGHSASTSLPEAEITPNATSPLTPSLQDFETAQYAGEKHTDGVAGEFYFKFKIETYKLKSWLNGILRHVPLLGNGKASKNASEGHASSPSYASSGFELGAQHYIGLAFVLMIMAILGAGIYQRFFLKTNNIFAYPSSPSAAARILSFQGRLTDSLGNPISAATDMRFRLYTASTAGTTLYDTGTCSITPDQDGVHNVLIGEDCGSEISSNVFTENTEVWLGVLVGSDAEMEPRQRIANVPYALNAETLQGLPVGTNASNIPYINAGGDLLMAASSPQIGSTYVSQTFLLSGASSITVQSAGSGDVTLTATESGTIKFATGGSQHGLITNAGLFGFGTGGPDGKLDVLYTGGEQLRLTYADGSAYTGFTTSSGGDLTIDATGNDITSADRFTIGSATAGVGKLTVTGAETGKALAIFNETGDQNIITASASGTTVANLDRSGNLAIEGAISDLGGATLAVNDNLDVSGTLTSGTADAFTVDATGNITTSGTTGLTFSSTGGIVLTGGTISDGTDGVDIADNLEVTGDTTLTGDLAINGDDLTSDGTTFNFSIANAGTINFKDGTNTLVAIKDQGVYAYLNIAGKTDTGDPATCADGDLYYNAFDDSVKVCHASNTWEALDGGATGGPWTESGTTSYLTDTTDEVVIGGTSPLSSAKLSIDGDDDQIQLIVQGNATQTTSLAVFEQSDGTDVLTISNAGDLATIGDLAVNGDDITSDGTLTVDAAADIILDADGADILFKDATVTFATFTNSSTDLTLDVVGGDLILANADVLNIGGNADDVAFSAIGDDTANAGNVNSDNDLYIEDDLEVDGTIFGNISGTITPGFTQGSVIFTGASGELAQDNASFFFNDTTNLLGIGTALPVAKLHVTGAVTGKALTILNETGDQDILTASASGVTRFRLANDGGLYAGYFLDISNAAYGLDPAGTSNFGGYSLKVTGGALLANDSGLVGIGNATPVGKLDVAGAVTGKALTILNETGNQNILTASASGTTVANLDRSGNLAIEGAISDLSSATLDVNDHLDVAGRLAAGTDGSTATADRIVDFDQTLTADSDQYGIVNEPTFSSTLTSAREMSGLYNNVVVDTYDANSNVSILYGINNKLTANAISDGSLTFLMGNQNFVTQTDSTTIANYGDYNQMSIGATAVTGDVVADYGYVGVAGDVTNGYGAYYQMALGGAGSSATTLYGMRGDVGVTSGGTVTTGNGIYGAITNSGTLTTGNAGYFDCDDAVTCNGVNISVTDGTPTTNYGIRLAVSGAATNNYGIWGDSGDWVLDENGNGTIGGTSSHGDLAIGETQNLKLYHDGTNSNIINTTGYLLVSGSSTTHVVLSNNGGSVGIADTTPDAFLDVTGTTAQLRLSYETADTNYAAFTTSSGGDLTVDVTGGQFLLANADVFNIGAVTGLAYNAISDSGTTGHSLASDDDLYIEGDLEVDGSLWADGTLTAGDLACTDCLDFDSFEDTLDIDATTDINLGASNLTIDLDSSGIFDIRDGTTTFVSFDDDSTIDVTFPAAGTLGIDAAATDNTTTAGVINLDVDTATDGNIGQSIDYQVVDSAGNVTGYGQKIDVTVDTDAAQSHTVNGSYIGLTANDASSTTYGLHIVAEDPGAQVATAGILVENLQATDIDLTTGLLIRATTDGSLPTGVDVSDAEITTGLSIGANTLLGTTGLIDYTNFDVDASGNVTMAGGTLTLSNGTSDLINWGSDGAADPSTSSAGWKTKFYGNSYGFGVAGGAMWAVSDGSYRWYDNDSTTYNWKADLDMDTDASFELYNESIASTVLLNTNGASYLNGGNVGINTAGPDARLDSLATTEQLRLTYTDGSVYSSFTVDSGGDLTIDPTGADIITDADILPNTDDTYDLGADAKRWKDIYLGPDTLHIGTSTTDEGTVGYVTSSNVFTFTNNFGDTDFGSTSDGFNFTLGGGAGDDFIVDTTTLVVESDNDRVGIGTAAPDGKFHVTGTSTGKALAILNETGDQNILVASASGVTQATLSRTGDLTLVGDLAVNGDDITSDGTLTIDAATDIILDADGADVFLKDATVTFATLTNSSTDLTLDVAGGQLIFADADTFNIGAVTGLAYNAISDSGTTGHSLASDDDLYVEGDLEVDGSLWADGTLTAGDLTCTDCLDFAELEDTLDLDAALTLNQSTNTWTQNFTGDTTTGLTYNANSITTGTAVAINSTATSFSSGTLLSLDWSPGSLNTNSDDLFKISTTNNGNMSANYVNLIKEGASVFSIAQSGNVTTSGDIAVNGDDITADGVLTINSASYVRIGDSGTPGSVSDDDDLYVESDFEVDARAFFDGGVTIGDDAADAVSVKSKDWTFENDTTVVLSGGVDGINFDSNTLSIDATNNRIGIGTAAPDAQLHVTGAQTGKALAIFNETGDQNILTASASGTTAFAVGRNGDIGPGNKNGIDGYGDQESLVPNGSFEVHNIATTNGADGWASVAGTSIIAASTSNHGDYALALNTGGTEEWKSNCFPIAGNTSRTYTLSLWAKDNGVEASATVRSRAYVYTTRANCEADSGTLRTTLTCDPGTSYTICSGTTTPVAGDVWGRVYIANTSASTKKFIDGVRFVSTLISTGLDLAETYPAATSDNIQMGEIVAMGTQGKQAGADVNNVKRSSKAYDNLAFGIIATKPGITLDDDQSYEKVGVALKGRVPVLVSSENGPIKVGDPITASSKPGIGMKATRSGRIIGYAMTEWTNPDPDAIDQVTVFVNPETWVDLSILTSLQESIANLPSITQSALVQAENIMVNAVDAALIRTNSLFAESITSVNATIDNLIVDRITGREIEAEKIKAKEIIAENVKADNIEAKDATLSGKLVAQEIDSENIRELRDRLERVALEQSSTPTIDSSELQAEVENIQTYLEGLDQEEEPQLPITNLEDNVSVEGLTVTGNAVMTSLMVSDSFSAGNVLIKNDTVLSLNNELKLSALETVNILDGAVVIAKNGTIHAKGEVVAEKGLRANTLKAIDAGKAVGLDLNNNSVAVTNNDQVVAEINASGSAKFHDVSVNTYTEATSSAAVIAAVDNYQQNGIFSPAIQTNAAAAGNGLLPAHNDTLIIFNDKITERSLIYITATSKTFNQNLYVEKKKSCTQQERIEDNCKPYFSVRIDGSARENISFNWSVVN